MPEQKVEERIPRTLQNIRKVLVLCDQVRILDNSRFDNPFIQVARLQNNSVSQYAYPLPVRASELLSDYLWYILDVAVVVLSRYFS